MDEAAQPVERRPGLAAWATLAPAVADMPREELTRLMQSRTAYRDFYSRLKDIPLAVSRDTGALL
jgi:hypothetical protein